MKTFRESLVWGTFNDEFPPFSTAQEREDYWTQNTHPELSRARELGVQFRAGQWSPEVEAEFNGLADQPDSFARLPKTDVSGQDCSPTQRRDRIFMTENAFNDIVQWSRS